ncbi:hypothetical protein GCM10020367_33590 [Streptomyces sannanensis]|uniref:non-specific serine/threonine protein kinase n=1 Tax=Streptomyces sannanensis TaxID=285536 RepID=A0ABP6SCY5_9ACTN
MAARAPQPTLAAGAAVAPRYEVLAHLGRTGWLDLYDAWSEERECRCVVKVLRSDRRNESRLRDRLLREGRWLQGFTHPHLVRAYETGETPEPFVVLETLTGETLAHLIWRRRRLAANDVAFLGLHICSAMHYLHGRGLLHLDLKPSNIAIDCRHAKVLDLSLARAPGQAARPGTGTRGYLAPEQARGGTLTAAADVWGIGVTLYEAATGDLPFGRAENGADDDRYPQLGTRAPSVRALRRLPRDLAEAIDGCLDPAPAARPTVPELAAVLDGLLPQGRRAVAPPPAE